MAAKKKEAPKAKDGPKKGRWDNYTIEGDTLTCRNEFSPKSDMPRMMANHKDRRTCGKTGYTEFAK